MSKSNSNSKKKKPTAQPARPPAPPTRHEPTAEAIRQRAYEIYVRRGGGQGRDVEDWIAAERELRGS